MYNTHTYIKCTTHIAIARIYIYIRKIKITVTSSCVRVNIEFTRVCVGDLAVAMEASTFHF